MEITTYAMIAIFMAFLLFIHIFGKSRGFGLFFGLTMIISGLLILTTGIQYKSGEIRALNDTAEPQYINVTNVYTNLSTNHSLENNGLGIASILFGLYAIINAIISSKLFQNND